MSDRILILDDKPLKEDFSSLRILSSLNEQQRELIDYYENTEVLWLEADIGDDIVLMKDFSPYPFVFIHDSFDDRLVKDGLKAVIIEKLSVTSNVVLFSGSKNENSSPVRILFDKGISTSSGCYEILRRQYYYNLSRFLDSYILTGKFDIVYLYNEYVNPKKDLGYGLLKKIISELEFSTSRAVNSDSFRALLTLYGYAGIDLIINRFASMNDDDFIENLEDLIESNPS